MNACRPRQWRRRLAITVVGATWLAAGFCTSVTAAGSSAPNGLVAASAPAGDLSPATLTSDVANAALARAVSEWSAIRPEANLGRVSVFVTDLPGLELGRISGHIVVVDSTAAGFGWSAMHPGDSTLRMDLLTVVRHELGHVVGYEHSATGLMAPTLAAGESRAVPETAPPVPTRVEKPSAPAGAASPPRQSKTTPPPATAERPTKPTQSSSPAAPSGPTAPARPKQPSKPAQPSTDTPPNPTGARPPAADGKSASGNTGGNSADNGAATPQAASGSTTADLPRKPLRVRTAPPLPGLRFDYKGRTFVTDKNGEFRIARDLLPAEAGVLRSLRVIKNLKLRSGANESGLEYRIERFYGVGAKTATTRAQAAELAQRPIRAAVNAYVRVSFEFVDRSGRKVEPASLDAVTIKRSDGAVFTLGPAALGGSPKLFQGNRVVPLSGELVAKDLDYRIQSVLVGGNNVVNRAQQAFTPMRSGKVRVELLFYSARVTARDMLFGFAIGSGVRLQFPDGHVETREFTNGHELVFPRLPRGSYEISVNAWGPSNPQPLTLTRDQVVELKVVSYLDIIAIVGTLLAIAAGLVAIGRGWSRRRVAAGPPRGVVTTARGTLEPSLLDDLVSALPESSQQEPSDSSERAPSIP